MASLAEQLASVQTAIEKLETNAVQSYSIEGQSFTYANLQTLYEREKSLMRRIAAQTNHGRTLAEF